MRRPPKAALVPSGLPGRAVPKSPAAAAGSMPSSIPKQASPWRPRRPQRRQRSPWTPRRRPRPCRRMQPGPLRQVLPLLPHRSLSSWLAKTAPARPSACPGLCRQNVGCCSVDCPGAHAAMLTALHCCPSIQEATRATLEVWQLLQQQMIGPHKVLDVGAHRA